MKNLSEPLFCSRSFLQGNTRLNCAARERSRAIFSCTSPRRFNRRTGGRPMAGIEFDRQAFIPSTTPQGRSAIQLLIPLITVSAIALVAYVGYKIYMVNEHNNEVIAVNSQVHQLEQQLAEMQKRIDSLERHRKAAPAEVNSPAPSSSNTVSATANRHTRAEYRIDTASKFPAQTKVAAPPQLQATPSVPSSVFASEEIAGEVAANHTAWEATTNRLADVVGVVG